MVTWAAWMVKMRVLAEHNISMIVDHEIHEQQQTLEKENL